MIQKFLMVLQEYASITYSVLCRKIKAKTVLYLHTETRVLYRKYSKVVTKYNQESTRDTHPLPWRQHASTSI